MKKERVDKIVAKVRARCKKLGVQLVIDKHHEYCDGTTFGEDSAYFCYEPHPHIKVATYRRAPEEWIPNMFHELTHAEQWKAGTLEWFQCFIDGVDVETIIELWTSGTVELTTGQRRNVFKRLQHLELMAEIGTVEKIRKYKLEDVISIEDYCQRAWAYIRSYNVTAITRRSIPSERPAYDIEEIVKVQPKTLAGLDGVLRIIHMHVHPTDEVKLFSKHYPQQFHRAKSRVRCTA
jgi:hypothetical protein